MKREYCDLNVIEKSNYFDNLQNVKQLLQLGYHTIALNCHYQLPVKETKKKEKGGVGTTLTKDQRQQILSFIASMKNLHDQLKSDIEGLKHSPPPTATDGVEFVVPSNFKLMSPDQFNYFRTPNIRLLLDSFDLIAICPTGEKVFTYLMSGKMECDILAFPMEHKTDFKVSLFYSLSCGRILRVKNCKDSINTLYIHKVFSRRVYSLLN